jgi:hypothetical protein
MWGCLLLILLRHDPTLTMYPGAMNWIAWSQMSPSYTSSYSTVFFDHPASWRRQFQKTNAEGNFWYTNQECRMNKTLPRCFSDKHILHFHSSSFKIMFPHSFVINSGPYFVSATLHETSSAYPIWITGISFCRLNRILRANSSVYNDQKLFLLQ